MHNLIYPVRLTPRVPARVRGEGRRECKTPAANAAGEIQHSTGSHAGGGGRIPNTKIQKVDSFNFHARRYHGSHSVDLS